MGNWGNYLLLQAKSKTGLTTNIVILAAAGAAMLIAASVLLLVAAFFLLETWLSPLWAATAMFGFFLVLGIILIVAAMQSRKSAMDRAQAALAARSAHALFDTSALSIGLQLGRNIGWKRFVPIAAVTLIAAGLAKEWARHKSPETGA